MFSKRGGDTAPRHREDSETAQEAQTFWTSAVTRVRQQCAQHTRRQDTPVGVVLDTGATAMCPTHQTLGHTGAVTRVRQQCVQHTRRRDTPVGVVLDD
jgi:hypothetical protein